MAGPRSVSENGKDQGKSDKGARDGRRGCETGRWRRSFRGPGRGTRVWSRVEIARHRAAPATPAQASARGPAGFSCAVQTGRTGPSWTRTKDAPRPRHPDASAPNPPDAAVPGQW